MTDIPTSDTREAQRQSERADAQRRRAETAEAENARLREALDFYACIDHYEDGAEPDVVRRDAGRRARKARASQPAASTNGLRSELDAAKEQVATWSDGMARRAASKIDAPIPPLPGHKGRTYLCKDSDGQRFYLNHARTWQAYSGPEAASEPIRPDYDLRCGDCGRPHILDTSLASETWNKIARPEETLCIVCIDRRLQAAGLEAEAQCYFAGEALRVPPDAVIRQELNATTDPARDAVVEAAREAQWYTEDHSNKRSVPSHCYRVVLAFDDPADAAAMTEALAALDRKESDDGSQ